MGTSAAEIRREIAQTRGELSETIEALEERLSETKESVVDRVSPKRVWHRKTTEVRQKLDDMSASITGMTRGTEAQMIRKSRGRGQVQELGERTEGAVGAVGEQARSVPTALRQRAEGNPMAAGLVALGAGFLAASLLPPTEQEQQAAGRVQSGLQPLKEEATKVGRTVAGELQQKAQASAEHLKERAGEAVQEVKHDTQTSSEELQGQVQQATTQVKRRAKSASRQVKDQASGNGSAGDGTNATRARPVRASRTSSR